MTSHSHQAYFPLSGVASQGFSNQDEASATCFCGSVQMKFPLKAPGLVGSFLCNCYDCRKLTASMFASNFTTLDSHTSFVRGDASDLTTFTQDTTTTTGNSMTNHFCSKCGILMFRVSSGFPGVRFMRCGTVDDFSLVEEGGPLFPRVEQFTKDRVGWLGAKEGVQQVEESALTK